MVVWLLLTWNSGAIGEQRIQPGYGEDSRRVFVTSSQDQGQTWPLSRQLYAGSSAYSCLVALSENTMGCL
ncbi:MAG: exo-alpha-sialidase [Pirellulales bacterium]|nr:exo-alpha-sialidase [Pirellulales bacterium]